MIIVHIKTETETVIKKILSYFNRRGYDIGKNSYKAKKLESYWVEKFIEYTDWAELLTEMDADFMLKTLDCIKVLQDRTLMIVFLGRTEIECKNEEE